MSNEWPCLRILEGKKLNLSVPGGSQRSKHSAFQKALKDAGVEYLDVPACTWLSFAERYLRSNKEVESNQTRKITDFIISSPNNERQVKIKMLELMGAINF